MNTLTRDRRWVFLIALAGLPYPPLVYFGLMTVPPAVFVLIGGLLICCRLVLSQRLGVKRAWLLSILIGAALATLLLASPTLAVKAYPVAVSLSVAAVFTISLVYPPSIIERIARLSDPHLPPKGVIYTRRVTFLWVAFLIANASISASLALWGSLEAWALWNGLLSYIAMGALFLFELGIRRRVQA